MVVVRFPVVLLIFIVVQVLTECIIVEFPPFTIIDIFAHSSKVPRVQDMVHKLASQHIVADKVESLIQSLDYRRFTSICKSRIVILMCWQCMCSLKLLFTTVLVIHGFALPLKPSFMRYKLSKVNNSSNTSNSYAAFTPECHVQRQGSTLGWNNGLLSGWSLHSHLHQKSHHSLPLHYSEGTGWRSVLDGQRDSLSHTDLHVPHMRMQTKHFQLKESVLPERSLMGLACFFAGEALSTVIWHQTLCGCFWTGQFLPQCPIALCATKLWGLLQVLETELRQELKMSQHWYHCWNKESYRNTVEAGHIYCIALCS